MENGISLARWGVHGLLKVMVLGLKVFISVVRLLQVGVFWVKTLLAWPCWVKIRCCTDGRRSSLTGRSGRSPGYYVSQELPVDGILIQA